MSSRQMAFQMTEAEFQRRFLEICEWRDLWKDDKDVTVAQIIDLNIEDEKERNRYRAVWVAAYRCAEKNEDGMRIRKIICWRGQGGKPQDVEIEFARS